MAKRIIWSIRARDDNQKILKYWLKRNKSNVYPRKLNKLFIEAIKLLAKNPIPRRLTDINDVYVKIIRDYKIFFKEDDKSIYIITIWDARQDPNNLKDILEK